MMHQSAYSVSAVILKRRNWGETDKILTLLTREIGKIRVIAKGVRKINSKRGGFLEPFRIVKLTLHAGNRLDYVTEVSSIAHIDNLNIQNIGYAYFVCELVDKLTPEAEKHEELYFLLQEILTKISKSADSKYIIKIFDDYANVLLKMLGYLDNQRVISYAEIIPFVERIVEKRLKSPKLIAKIQNNM
jgi:DNA repair protein RecO (recombination protein O)